MGLCIFLCGCNDPSLHELLWSILWNVFQCKKVKLSDEPPYSCLTEAATVTDWGLAGSPSFSIGGLAICQPQFQREYGAQNDPLIVVELKQP